MNKHIFVFWGLAAIALLCAPLFVFAEDASAIPSPSPESSPSPEVSPSVVASIEPSVAPSVAVSVSPSASASASATADARGRGVGQVKQQARAAVQDALKGARGFVRAKWFKWRFVWAHATGIAVTDGAEEYHAFSIHGRVLRYIPYDAIQVLKAGAANGTAPCQNESCLDQYGVEKAIGVMRFGAVGNAQGENYWFVGDWNDAAKSLVADVYASPYSFACLTGSPNCTATKIGWVNATLKSDFEGFKHLVVGKASFTGGAYAGKSFNLFAFGWGNPRAMRIQTQAQLVNA
ncbi:MAG: hypothetical protein V1817_03215 [Candidatus Micrarchaeota archaeon]